MTNLIHIVLEHNSYFEHTEALCAFTDEAAAIAYVKEREETHHSHDSSVYAIHTTYMDVTGMDTIDTETIDGDYDIDTIEIIRPAA